jgi:hypothetical protein
MTNVNVPTAPDRSGTRVIKRDSSSGATRSWRRRPSSAESQLRLARFPETPVFDASHTVDLIGNSLFALLAVVLLASATIRCEKP